MLRHPAGLYKSVFVCFFFYSDSTGCLKTNQTNKQKQPEGHLAGSAQSVEHGLWIFQVMSSTPTLGVESKKKKNQTKRTPSPKQTKNPNPDKWATPPGIFI